ncbi:hypothetical protein BV898_04848 [Hypsibius exemplaris]|uniref:MYND-type domain-containing protein n=1 Tax=Hypsibius exemplaris TaxID=2072580 RepID=A0A1W0X0U5_HYPEX|nr:hypothetical protein BV898_04848 [Hypsibius exemplaris]
METQNNCGIAGDDYRAGRFCNAKHKENHLEKETPRSSSEIPANASGSHTEFNPGDVIMSSFPWTYTILPELMEKLCYRCLKSLPILLSTAEFDLSLTCPTCNVPVYCSEKCRTEDWMEPVGDEVSIAPHSHLKMPVEITGSASSCLIGRHQQECNALLQASYDRKAALDLPVDFFLMMGAIKKLGRKEPADRFGQCIPPTTRTFDSLLCHSEEFALSEDRMLYVDLLKEKLQPCLSAAEMPNDREFLRIFGCLQINCFGIRSPFLIGVGEGLYLGPSVIDHSCEKNAVFLFQGTQILIKAIAPIASLSEARISYTELFVPMGVRNRRFKNGYYFECSCRLCCDEKLFADFYPMKCATSTCTAAIPLDQRSLLNCLDCNHPAASEESLAAARLFVRRYLEGIEEMDDRIKLPEWDMPDIVADFRNVERRAEKILHPTNLLLGMILDRHARLVGSLGDNEKAFDYFRKSLPAFRIFFKPFDTKLAVQILMTGLSAYLAGAYREACAFLREASEKLIISDGAGRPLVDASLILLGVSSVENSTQPVVDLKFTFLAKTLLSLLTNIRIERLSHIYEQQVQVLLASS